MGERVLRNGRAIVLHQGSFAGGDVNERMINSHDKAVSCNNIL